MGPPLGHHHGTPSRSAEPVEASSTELPSAVNFGGGARCREGLLISVQAPVAQPPCRPLSSSASVVPAQGGSRAPAGNTGSGHSAGAGRRGAPDRVPGRSSSCNDIHRHHRWAERWSWRHLDPGLLAAPVALALQHQFVGTVDQAVHRPLGEQGIGHGRQPLRRLPVRHCDDRPAAVPFDD